MEYRALFCVALVLIVGQTRALILDGKELSDLGDNAVVSIGKPSEGENSALKLTYRSSIFNTNFQKTVTLSAPEGYGLFVAFIKIDLKSVDTLTLSEPGTGNQKTYQNINAKNSNEQFYAPSGKIQVSFKTANKDMSTDLGSFEFTCTVQGNVNKPETCKADVFKCTNGRCIAKALKCNTFALTKYQHCGDGSDHSKDACKNDFLEKAKTTVGVIVGIVIGVIVAVIVVGGIIAFLIFRRVSQRSRNQGYVR